MLIARLENSTLVDADDVDRGDGPFYCPECEAEVVLKQGRIKTSHYAHKPPVFCEYGLGESEDHRYCKRAIYRGLKDLPFVTKCAMERHLGTVRPDVSCYIRGVPVAIEVQCSTLSPSQLFYRTEQYALKKVSVLWLSILHQKPIHHSERGARYRPVAHWERWLSSLYFGRMYFWNGNDAAWSTVLPVHFADVLTWVEETKWGGGYFKRHKRDKELLYGQYLNLAEDFASKKREAWESLQISLPSALLYSDRLEKWW